MLDTAGGQCQGLRPNGLRIIVTSSSPEHTWGCGRLERWRLSHASCFLYPMEWEHLRASSCRGSHVWRQNAGEPVLKFRSETWLCCSLSVPLVIGSWSV